MNKVHTPKSLLDYVKNVQLIEVKKNELRVVEGQIKVIENDSDLFETVSDLYSKSVCQVIETYLQENLNTLMKEKFQLQLEINDLERKVIDFEFKAYFED